MINILKKFFLYPLILLIFISSIIISVYYISFAPKTQVEPINKTITIDNWYLLKKFTPTDFNLSLKEAYVESATSFSQSELTDLFILGVNEIPEAKKYITGLKVEIVDGFINIIFHVNYHDIPFEGKLIFSCKAENGKGIFHYEEGKVGFINIPKDIIFENAEDTSIIQFNKNTGDIILSFNTIKNLDVRNVKIQNNSVDITFRGTLKFGN